MKNLFEVVLRLAADAGQPACLEEKDKNKEFDI